MPRTEKEPTVQNESAFKHLFNQTLITRIVKALQGAYPTFNQKQFKIHIKGIEKLEMKARVHLLRDAMAATLPTHYPAALKILLESTTSGALKGFDIWPYTEYIQKYGLDHHALSLHALKTLTSLFTSEWAVRPFLRTAPGETLSWLEKCAKDRNAHVRRWASEGSRSRLPWGERLNHLIAHPKLTLPILESLKHDPELYVRKSVANHLNDISKDNPTLVINTLKRWLKEARPDQRPRIDWILKHALRTMIKSGDRNALELIGVAPDAPVVISQFRIDREKVTLGERVGFTFVVHSKSQRPEKLVVDYIIHYLRANGKHSAKVFKLKTISLPAKARVPITGKHHFREVTTRTHYSGEHRLEIQINGRILKKVTIQLKTS
jgi:3-methyladenine DNA glycosylase AlkC